MAKSDDDDASFHSAAPSLDGMHDENDVSFGREALKEGGPDPNTDDLGLSIAKSKATSTETEFPPMPPDVAKLEFLEAGIAADCQTFLRSEELYTSRQFMELSIGELADRYTAFRKRQGTNLGPGNARVYINKYRRLLRDALGMASEGEVAKYLAGNKKVYCIVAQERVDVAEAEQEQAAEAAETEQRKAVEVTETEQDKTKKSTPSPTAGRTLRSTRSSLKRNAATYKEDSDEETGKIAPALESETQVKTKSKAKAKPAATARKAPPKSKNPLVEFFSMELKEPGSLGMKIENTATGGLRISEIIKDLQAESVGLKVGDIVASATVDSPVNVDEVGDSAWQKDMLFQDFISLAKSQKRPMMVHVRRGAASAKPAAAVAAERAHQAQKRKRESKSGSTPVSTRKRNRVDKYLNAASQRILNVPITSPLRQMELQKALALGTKRYKPTHRELHERRLAKSRKLRMDIVRAFKLRMAADEMESLVPPSIDSVSHDDEEEDSARLKERHEIMDKEGSRTQSTVRDMVRESMLQNIQRMREEANELYNHPDHKEWEGNFKYLLDYKLREGHTMVSKTCEDKRLAEFTRNAKMRRRTYLNNAIKSKEKMEFMGLEVDILNSIEFTWNATVSRTWDDNFQKLVTFKNDHGHCVVPTAKKPGHDFRSLSIWIQRERRRYREMKAHPADLPRPRKMMTDEQMDKLTSLGMVWQANTERTWEDYFEELLQFKAENGHASVPQIYAPNRALGNWVHRMRRHMRMRRRGLHHKQKTLTDDRLQLLEDVGFVWMTKPTPKRDWASTRSKPEAIEMPLDSVPASENAAKFQRQQKARTPKKAATAVKAMQDSENETEDEDADQGESQNEDNEGDSQNIEEDDNSEGSEQAEEVLYAHEEMANNQYQQPQHHDIYAQEMPHLPPQAQYPQPQMHQFQQQQQPPPIVPLPPAEEEDQPLWRWGTTRLQSRYSLILWQWNLESISVFLSMFKDIALSLFDLCMWFITQWLHTGHQRLRWLRLSR